MKQRIFLSLILMGVASATLMGMTGSTAGDFEKALNRFKSDRTDESARQETVRLYNIILSSGRPTYINKARGMIAGIDITTPVTRRPVTPPPGPRPGPAVVGLTADEKRSLAALEKGLADIENLMRGGKKANASQETETLDTAEAMFIDLFQQRRNLYNSIAAHDKALADDTIGKIDRRGYTLLTVIKNRRAAQDDELTEETMAEIAEVYGLPDIEKGPSVEEQGQQAVDIWLKALADKNNELERAIGKAEAYEGALPPARKEEIGQMISAIQKQFGKNAVPGSLLERYNALGGAAPTPPTPPAGKTEAQKQAELVAQIKSDLIAGKLFDDTRRAIELAKLERLPSKTKDATDLIAAMQYYNDLQGSIADFEIKSRQATTDVQLKQPALIAQHGNLRDEIVKNPAGFTAEQWKAVIAPLKKDFDAASKEYTPRLQAAIEREKKEATPPPAPAAKLTVGEVMADPGKWTAKDLPALKALSASLPAGVDKDAVDQIIDDLS